MTSQSSASFANTPLSRDVVVLGGGLAGLTAALQLKQASPDLTITVLEKHSHPAPEAAFKVGESTVEIAAMYFTSVLKLDDHLKQEQLPKLGLRCFFHNSKSPKLEDRVEFGSNQFFPRNTFQVDRGRLENYLAEKLQSLGVEFLDQTHIRELTVRSETEEGMAHLVAAERLGERINYEASWLIDASGRAALLKHKLGLAEESSHNINAVWFRIGAKIDIDTWCKDPSWTAHNHGRTSRWFSTNHLMGEGYWVWIIPLASGSTSIGIVSDPRLHPLDQQNSFEKALAWLEEYEPLCADAVRAEAHHLQDFLALKNFSRRSSQLFSPNRWAITGDSGIFIDPLYSPGSDYIAFSNTLICELITRERSGKKIQALSKVYNDLLRSFADNTFLLYEDLYQIFGNPRVMPVKIVWDFAIYWAFFAFLFAHHKLTDLTMFMRVSNDLKWLSTMNREMQALFREWGAIEKEDLGRRFFDIASIGSLFERNRVLTTPLSDEDFQTQMAANLKWLSAIGHEMADMICLRCPELSRPAFQGSYKEGAREDSRGTMPEGELLLAPLWSAFFGAVPQRDSQSDAFKQATRPAMQFP